MSMRRTVSDQPRNWSQESSESQEEMVVYAGNRTLQPARQPSGPPSETRAQQDKGFARFLEKHSSPTHQRVTAGGRIVPMEQRPRPPVFSLPAASTGAPDLGKDFPKELHSPLIRASAQKEGNSRISPEQGMKVAKEVLPQVSAHSEATDNYGLGAGLDTAFTFPPVPLGANPGSAQSATFPVVHPSPLFSGVSFDPYGAHSPQIFPMNATLFGQGVGAYSGPLGAQYHPTLYPYGDLYGVPGTSPMLTGEAYSTYCQHMILTVKSAFEELENQLRSIDRCRAMINHDANLSQQRMAVAKQRSDMKDEIKYWENKLAFALNNPTPTPYQAIHHGTTLNVQAESYVPLNSAPATAALPLSGGVAIDSTANSFESNTVAYSTTTRAPRRAIPIVAPQKPSPPAEETILGAVGNVHSSPASDVAVDEWGVRIGRPPPHIEQQQKEMLAVIVCAGSESPDEAVESVIAAVSQTSSKSSSFNHQAVATIPDTIIEGDSENTEWLPVNPGDAPATVEAYYELQLDAMRLPQGVVSLVKLPDGTITQVPGRGLQRPPSSNMDDFERRYWTSKPTMTKEMADQFIDVRRSSDGKPLSQLSSSLISLSTEGFSTMTNSCRELSVVKPENTRGSKSSQGSHSSPQNVASFEQNERHKLADVPPVTSHGGMCSLNQPLASGSNIWTQGDNKSNWPSQDRLMKDWECGQDANLNKGYSSVSVQNVHAMGHLPHMLDGTTDSQKFSAKSLLSAAGKVRSP
ncbi:uncharacterized protein A1O9_10945, partial [Exophiala aquamarina CBS 119918]